MATNVQIRLQASLRNCFKTKTYVTTEALRVGRLDSNRLF